MKKTLCFILALVMLLALAGCGAARETTDATDAALSDVPPTPMPPAAETDADGSWANVVEVSAVDELLAAIGDETKIILAEGNYDLSNAADYGAAADGARYRWEEVYDMETEGYTGTAFELIISGVKNLAIVAADGAKVTISAVPRYANVLRFESCSDLVLHGMTVGHTEEPGVCAGGVVLLDSVNGAKISACSLYGCGTVGVQAYTCRNVYVSDSSIFDCSESAVVSSQSTDVRVERCDVFDCGLSGFSAIFSADTTTGFAVVNTDIRNCTGAALFGASSTHGAALLGCGVNGSTAFERGLFEITGESVTVDKCRFEGGIYFPLLYSEFTDGTAVTADGEELTQDKLFAMERAEAEYTLPETASAPEVDLDVTVNADGVREIHVSTVDELLAAIAPDTAIYLDAELYDLSAATVYGGAGGEWYGWVENFDGPELVIYGVENLRIIGAEGVNATISAVPRYADVLTFSGCAYIGISNVTLGHTEEPGECSGGVLNFSQCDSVTVDRSRIFGCGTVGVTADNSRGIAVNDTEIYDCSYSAASLYTCSDVAFTNCNIHHCGTPELVIADSSVSYDGETLKSLDYTFEGGKLVEYVYPDMH